MIMWPYTCFIFYSILYISEWNTLVFLKAGSFVKYIFMVLPCELNDDDGSNYQSSVTRLANDLRNMAD